MTTTPTPRGIVVFSGGSAANSLVDVFIKVVENRKCSLSYIIPISDNGGSSSELIRVFGGPGIGDVRSKSNQHAPINTPRYGQSHKQQYINLKPRPPRPPHP